VEESMRKNGCAYTKADILHTGFNSFIPTEMEIKIRECSK
jgi:hypothetical protein